MDDSISRFRTDGTAVATAPTTLAGTINSLSPINKLMGESLLAGMTLEMVLEINAHM